MVPWQRYQRRKIRPGLSYPVQQTEVRDALRSQDATVGELILYWWSDSEWRDVVKTDHPRLMSEEWTGTDTQLWVYAVPSDQRQAAHGIAVTLALPKTVSWLKRIPSRGNAWSATRHRWTVELVNGELVFDEP